MGDSARALRPEADQPLSEAVSLRRRLHARPELGLDTPETFAALLEFPADLDLEIAHSEKTSGFAACASSMSERREIAQFSSAQSPSSGGGQILITKEGATWAPRPPHRPEARARVLRGC